MKGRATPILIFLIYSLLGMNLPILSMEGNSSQNQQQQVQKQNFQTFKWGVVFGGDKTLETAQWEINRAIGLKYKNAVIFYRSGWYRSVILFSSQAQAETEKRRKISAKLRKGSYTINIKDWCPYGLSNPRREKGIDYFQC